jgi:hypothetical protein
MRRAVERVDGLHSAQGMATGNRFVYILRSVGDPERHYVGLPGFDRWDTI